MRWKNRYIFEVAFLVAAVATMMACGSGLQEHGQYQARDSTIEFRNEIPALAAAILEQGDHFELLSLDPQFQVKPRHGNFGGYTVLSMAVINDPETRKKIVTAFKQAVAENQGMIAACFNPRHGIHVTRNGKRADFVICFECAQVQVYGDVNGKFLIAGSARALFDSVLRSSGVPRADK